MITFAQGQQKVSDSVCPSAFATLMVACRDGQRGTDLEATFLKIAPRIAG